MNIIKKTLKLSLLLIVLLLITLSFAGKYAAIYFLETEKNIKANIGELSINLLTGKISLQGVHLYGEAAEGADGIYGIGGAIAGKRELHLGQLSVDLDILALFSKNVLIESIDFHDFQTNVTELNDGWNVGGFFIPLPNEEPNEVSEESASGEKQKFDWGYGVSNIAFSNIKINLTSQYADSDFILNQLKVKDLFSWNPNNAADLIVDLSINDQVFQIDGDFSLFLSEPMVKANVVMKDLQMRPFLKSVKDLPFDEVSVAVFTDFDLTLISKTDQVQIEINGDYGLKNLHLVDKSRNVKISKLYWDGSQKIILPKDGVKNIYLDGLLGVENITVVDFDNNVKLSQKKIELAGQYNIAIDEGASEPSVFATASLMLEKLDVNSLDGNVKLASFDRWFVKNIKMESIDNIAVESAELNNLILLKDGENKKSPAVVMLDKFLVSNVQYDPSKVEIEKVDFFHLNADIILDEKGDIPVLAFFSSKQKALPDDDVAVNEDVIEIKPRKNDNKSTNSAKKTNENKLAIVLKEISINSNSNIHFVDNSVTPVFDTKLKNLKLLLTDVDSRNKEKSIKVDFSVKIDEYSALVLKGDINPFSDKLNAKLLVNLDELELTPLSSYAAKFAGMNIKRGTLDIDADIGIKNDTLNVKNTFTLNQLNFESDDSEVSDNIFKDMPMPLDLVLDVLRDKKNVIKLDIPVTGDINNPDFRLQDIYNTAMVKAMKFAATQYLMQAVQPLGLIITAGKLAGKAMVPKFSPLVFELNSVEISNDNKKSIKKLAKVLQDKERLKFTVCGSATASDWKAILASANEDGSKNAKSDKADKIAVSADSKSRDQVLLKLANDRTKTVKKYFVDTYKISPKRLFACNGKIVKDEKNKSAVPSVEITL